MRINIFTNAKFPSLKSHGRKKQIFPRKKLSKLSEKKEARHAQSNRLLSCVIINVRIKIYKFDY